MGSQFKVKLKVELEIEGTRDDIPLISEAVGHQITGLLTPTSQIVEGEIAPPLALSSGTSLTNPSTNGKKRASQRKPKPHGNKEQTDTKIEWTHEPKKWGLPKQEWSILSKCVWLLYVLSQVSGHAELSAADISNTFNASFKGSGMIRASNVSRDLGKASANQNAYIRKDSTNTPVIWYLTQSGEKYAQTLIQEALVE